MNKKFKNIIYILSIISFVCMFLVLSKMPDRVPTHFDFSGKPDGYGSKYLYLFLSFLSILIILMGDLLPRIDPKKDNYRYHTKAYQVSIGATAVVFLVLPWAIIGQVAGLNYDVASAVEIMIGLLFVVIGNYMPTFKQNYFSGIKTPWTLANEEVWRKTHRFGGYVFMVFGLFMVISSLFKNEFMLVASIVFMLIGVVGMYVYSYVVFKNIENKQ